MLQRTSFGRLGLIIMIELTTLVMRNFRRFRGDCTIPFTEGVMGILGPNGAGKSTILDAVGFAFYGAVPVLVRTVKDDMKHSLAADDEPWGVELQFTDGEYDYKIIRMVKYAPGNLTPKPEVKLMRRAAGSTAAYATYAKDDTDVKKCVQRLLGMDYPSFSSSVFCRQAEMALLGNMNPADRKRLMLRMLDVDSIDAALKSLRAAKRDLEFRINSTTESLKDSDGNDVKHLAQARKVEAQAAIASGKEDLRRLENDAKGVQEQLDELASEIKEQYAVRTGIESARATAKELMHDRERVKTLEAEKAKIMTRLDELQSAMFTVDARLAEEYPALEERLTELAVRDKELLRRSMDASACVAEYQNLSTTAPCPTCGQDVDGTVLERLIEQEKKGIQQIDEEAQAVLKEYDETQSKLTTAKQERDNIQANNETGIKIKSVKERLGSIEKELCELKAKPRPENIIDPDTVDEQLAGVDKAIEKLELNSKSHRALLETTNKSITDYREKLARLDEQLKNSNSVIAEYDTKKKNATGITRDISRHEQTEKLMNDFKLYLLGRIRPMISFYASELVSAMTDGRYTRVELDPDYRIFVYDGGAAYDLDRFSGGEKDVVNLALRLALSRLITERALEGAEGEGENNDNNKSFVMLDEVFGSADTERRRAIMDTLTGLESQYGQIICITHIAEVTDMLPKLVTIDMQMDYSTINENVWR